MKHGQERRQYIRVETPLQIRVISENNKIYEATTKDISPIGLRFEIAGEGLKVRDEVELTLIIPEITSPLHMRARVMWTKKLSSEDTSPYDIGCEFTKIEEDNKNSFLKYFSDLLYKLGEGR